MKKSISTSFFLFGAISMIAMSLHYFQLDVTGVMKGKSISSEAWYRYCLRIHILFGIVAITVGPFQFIKKLRTCFSQLHRKIGYLYFGSVIISSLTGLVVAQHAMGGWSTRIGFSILAILWCSSTILAVKAILDKDLTKHRKWIYLSYGLTFSAITQRTLLLIVFISAFDFMDIYRWSAWLPWMLNATLAVFLFNRSLTKA